MTPQQKIKQAIKLQQAKLTGDEAFILLEKLDTLEDRLEELKPDEIIIDLQIV